jgi:hypothetical protein
MPLAQLAVDGTLRFPHLQELDDAFAAPESVQAQSTPRDLRSLLEARLALRDAHVSALCTLEKLPAAPRALLLRRLDSVDFWHRRACNELNLSPTGSNPYIRADSTPRAPARCERAARDIDIGLAVAARLRAFAAAFESHESTFLALALNEYEKEIGRTHAVIDKAEEEGVPGAMEALVDVLGHLDQCDLPVLIYNAPGKGTGYLEALGKLRSDVEQQRAGPTQIALNIQPSPQAPRQEPRSALTAPADHKVHGVSTGATPTIAGPGPGMIATEWENSDSDNESDNESDSEVGTLRERGKSRA